MLSMPISLINPSITFPTRPDGSKRQQQTIMRDLGQMSSWSRNTQDKLILSPSIHLSLSQIIISTQTKLILSKKGQPKLASSKQVMRQVNINITCNPSRQLSDYLIRMDKLPERADLDSSARLARSRWSPDPLKQAAATAWRSHWWHSWAGVRSMASSYDPHQIYSNEELFHSGNWACSHIGGYPNLDTPEHSQYYQYHNLITRKEITTFYRTKHRS